jgi:hypothetical protein
MKLKSLALVAAMSVILLAASALTAQTAVRPTAGSQTHPPATQSSSANNPEWTGNAVDEKPPQTIVNVPPQLPAPWTRHEQIAWAAGLILTMLGYAGIWLAISTLKKIERHTAVAETSAQAALATAQAALLQTQSIRQAERPWLLISVEPSIAKENSFSVIATNRGRSPLSVVTAADQIQFAIDEANLPAAPAFKTPEGAPPLAPIILLQGESAPIKSFSRDEVKALCASDEQFKRLEDWEEKLFICGKVVYRDLVAASEEQTHETGWCCWYIHGRQRSGMVMAAPPAYNAHT